MTSENLPEEADAAQHAIDCSSNSSNIEVEIESVEVREVDKRVDDSRFALDSPVYGKDHGSSSVEPVVEVTDASKSYFGVLKGGAEDAGKILNGFNMKVPKGAIYSLLGSSGCGKTTVLSCIVNLRKLDEGTIKVFGHKPGSPESGVPGPNVGYMPQELCLYEYLTIVETMQYFGKLYGMDEKNIMENTDFVMKLLNLQEVDNVVDTLSGGQKRRASFALALLHKPKLLILDEPTVGVDPVLRERIWTYLRSLADTQQTTVIITTHYVEEARQSDMVGLMGNGKLIYENSPEALLRYTGARLLADAVFLVYQRSTDSSKCGCSLEQCGKPECKVMKNVKTLIKRASFGDDNTKKETRKKAEGVKYMYAQKNFNLDQQKVSSASGTDSARDSKSSSSYKTIGSLLKRNFIQMMRNPWYLFFLLALPAIQVLASVFSIGQNPHSMKLGVVDYEHAFNGTHGRMISREELELCGNRSLSCTYLNLIPERDVLLYSYANEEMALDAVKVSTISAFITFPSNFTSHIKDRIVFNNFAENQTLEGSQIRLRKDNTDVLLALRLEQVLMDYLQKFILIVLKSFDDDPRVGMLPLNFSKPVYGSQEISHQSYVAAGIILICSTLFPMCTTAMQIIGDKNRGTMQRTLVAGVKKTQILSSELITQGLFLIIQTSLMYLIVVTVSEVEVQGSVLLSMFLTYLHGLLGVSFGFLLPLICKKEVEALLLSSGLVLPVIIVSAQAWPLEYMPKWLQYFSYILPHTFPGISMRAIFNRGWPLTHSYVWPGFVMPFVWIVISWIPILKYDVLSK